LGLDAFATLGCQGLRHRHRLDEADQADQHRRRQQQQNQCRLQHWQTQRGQSARYFADDPHAGIGKPEGADRRDGQ